MAKPGLQQHHCMRQKVERAVPRVAVKLEATVHVVCRRATSERFDNSRTCSLLGKRSYGRVTVDSTALEGQPCPARLTTESFGTADMRVEENVVHLLTNATLISVMRNHCSILCRSRRLHQGPFSHQSPGPCP